MTPMDSLRWFKFDSKLWRAGRICIEDYNVQGVFLNCCLLYWDRAGDLELQHMRRAVNADAEIDRLIERDLIHVQDDMVHIKWIQQEIQKANSRRQQSKKAAKARWSDADAMREHSLSNAKRKQKKTKQKKFTPPQLKDVIDYYAEKGHSKNDAEVFFYYYDSQGWIKSNGMPIANWKNTAQTWWSKDKKNAPKINLLADVKRR